MKITDYFIRHPRIMVAAITAIILAGLMTYIHIPRAEDPGFIMRTAVVTAVFPGANPERVENLVTDKIEKAIKDMPEVKTIKSQSRENFVIIYVEVKAEYKNMRPIWDSLRRKMEKVKAELPSEVNGPTVNDEFYDVYGTVLALKADGYSYSQMEDFADEAKREFQQLKNVAKVDIMGVQKEKIYIEYSNAKLAAAGVSPYMIKQLLESRNIMIPGGEVVIGKERISFEPSGNFNSVQELRNVVITVPGKSEVLHLGDLVDIKRGYSDPPTTMVRSNGEKAICIALSLKDGGNVIDMGKEVEEKLEYLKQKLPLGVEFERVYYQPELVQKKVDEFISNLLESIIIVLIVMMIALGKRTGILVSSIIPVVIFFTFIIMNSIGIGLDQVSLAALMIALGILVDNSVVVSEAIMVNIENGMKKYDAAIKAVKELMQPLLIATLIISVTFLPMYICNSAMREYIGGLFLVISISLLLSWTLSITFIPFLCERFLKVKHESGKEQYGSFYYVIYKKILITLLKNRVITIIGIILIFSAAIYSLKFIPKIFFPESDNPIISASIRLKSGSDIKETEKVVKSIEEYMAKELKVNKYRKDGIKNWGVFIGQGAPVYTLSYSPEQEAKEYAYMLINVSDEKEIKKIILKLEQFINNKYPDVEFVGKRLETGMPIGKPISIRIMGRDNKEVMKIAESVKAKLISIKGTKNVTNDWEEQSKQIKINIDQARAMKAGMTSMDVAISNYTMLNGMDVTSYREGNDSIPVILKARPDEKDSIEKIKTSNVYSMQNGNSISLKQIADVSIEWKPSTIYKKDRLKVATISANIDGRTADEVMQELLPWLKNENKNWGVENKFEIGGEKESSGEHMGAIVEKMPISMAIIIMLLLIQFNSFRKLTIILLTIPLGLIGAIMGLLITKSYFGFMTLLGFISLIGVVINNGIMLLDRIKYELEVEKHPPHIAIINAAVRRLRPILLTMTATVSGLTILWLKGGLMWQPMAISIVFGLLFATVLTLGVVPVLYSIMFGIKYKN